MAGDTNQSNATPTATQDNRRAVAERNRNRVATLMQGRQPAERFLATLISRIADPLEVAKVLDEIAGTVGVNMEEEIPGLPGRRLRHVVGRTRAQLVRDHGEEGAEKAVAAMEAAGLQLAETMRVQTPTDETESRAAGAPRVPHAPPEQFAGSARIGPAMILDEPTFGRDQFPASEIWDLPDGELRQIDGISDADVAELRRLRDANARRIAALPPAAPVVPLVAANPNENATVGAAPATATPPGEPPAPGTANAGASSPASPTPGPSGGKSGRKAANGGKGGGTGAATPAPTPAATPPGGAPAEGEGAAGNQGDTGEGGAG